MQYWSLHDYIDVSFKEWYDEVIKSKSECGRWKVIRAAKYVIFGVASGNGKYLLAKNFYWGIERTFEGVGATSNQLILWDHDHLLSNCLELLDDDRTEIRRIKSATTSRVFWKVPSQSFRGAQQRDYTCTEKFCSCRSFSEMARTTTSEILCKHLLAVRIGTALNMIVEQVVPDNLFADLMCDWASLLY
jgi:SWIM zinc finger